MTTLVGAVVQALALLVASVQGAQPAARTAETVQLEPAATEPAPVWPTQLGPCAEWAPTAFDVGWPVSQWPTLSRILWCESRCNPAARNRSGADGLMQVLAHWFSAGENPFDPATNLGVALRVWHAQGWRAWSCY